MIMPFGTYMRPKRLTDLAAVCAIADSAGTMLSSSGNATAAPRPRNTVRREMAFFVTYISVAPANRRHTEGRALHDTSNQRRPAIAVGRRVARDLPHRRLIVVL